MRPFEFIIPKRPVSQQTRRRENLRAWKAYVRSVAESYWSDEYEKENGPVCITLIFLFDEVAIDVDNIIKPIQDALIGLAFENDSQVTDAISRRRNLKTQFVLEDVSPILMSGFDLKDEFVYVKISDAPGQEYLQ
ncbi:MAG TPA: RusA family crossover junction endodeoxyribonuclease [Anaerolineales bacterium]|nr:RusA family crossover junction endodeoxyribonuclease [Anaerolineales bacterium]